MQFTLHTLENFYWCCAKYAVDRWVCIHGSHGHFYLEMEQVAHTTMESIICSNNAACKGCLDAVQPNILSLFLTLSCVSVGAEDKPVEQTAQQNDTIAPVNSNADQEKSKEKDDDTIDTITKVQAPAARPVDDIDFVNLVITPEDIEAARLRRQRQKKLKRKSKSPKTDAGTTPDGNPLLCTERVGTSSFRAFLPDHLWLLPRMLCHLDNTTTSFRSRWTLIMTPRTWPDTSVEPALEGSVWVNSVRLFVACFR